MKISKLILVASFLILVIQNGYCNEDVPEGYELIIEDGHLIQRKIGETLYLQDAIRYAEEEAESIRQGIQESRRQAQESDDWVNVEEPSKSIFDNIAEGVVWFLGLGPTED